MKGDEMLSFMPGIKTAGASFPGIREPCSKAPGTDVRFLKPGWAARWGPKSLTTAGGGQHTLRRRFREWKPHQSHSTFVRLESCASRCEIRAWHQPCR